MQVCTSLQRETTCILLHWFAYAAMEENSLFQCKVAVHVVARV